MFILTVAGSGQILKNISGADIKYNDISWLWLDFYVVKCIIHSKTPPF
jgi:hypothetical protein